VILTKALKTPNGLESTSHGLDFTKLYWHESTIQKYSHFGHFADIIFTILATMASRLIQQYITEGLL